MKFKAHLFIGLIASFILVKFFNFSPLAGLFIFLASWMIDGDHYFWYALEMKDWNPINAIKWYMKKIPKWRKLTSEEREKFKRGVLLCHGIEFFAILIALSFVHEFFLWILIGVTIHMIADWIDLIILREPIYNKLFPFWVMKRNRGKKELSEL